MSNKIILKILLNCTLYSKSKFQGFRPPVQNISLDSLSPLFYSKLTSPIYPTLVIINFLFIPVKFLLSSIIPQDIKSDTP